MKSTDPMTHAHCPDPYIVDLTKILLRSGIVHIFEKTEVIFISLKSTSDNSNILALLL